MKGNTIKIICNNCDGTGIFIGTIPTETMTGLVCNKCQGSGCIDGNKCSGVEFKKRLATKDIKTVIRRDRRKITYSKFLTKDKWE